MTSTKERVGRLRYIYVTDQGEVFGSVDPPTREDLRFAALRMLTIVRLGDLRYRGVDSDWNRIPAGELASGVSNGPSTGFHAPVAGAKGHRRD